MNLNFSKEDANEIGALSEKLDSIVGAMELPLPPDFHMRMVRLGLKETSAQLKELYVKITGENPWNENETPRTSG